MDDIIRNVSDIDSADRRALEHVIPSAYLARRGNSHCTTAPLSATLLQLHSPGGESNQEAAMGRAILSVVVGYVAMFAAIFLTLSGLYLLLGQDLSFRPGSYEPSLLWTAVSFALGVGAAVLGGYVCAWIARAATPPKVLAGVVLVIGLVSAVPVVMAAATPAETRTGDVGNLDAMLKAKQPAWVAVANPFVGLAGILLGARLRRPTTAA